MTEHPVDRAALILGSVAALARALGVTKAAAHQWKESGRRVPIEHCTPIELATGGVVTRRDLRPDDWWRIWPELVTAEHPAPEARQEAA
jgi:DNA-binding transcriptional regulator YdaS (Cro superfamily)